jgi:CheY-like chemotaxis protein
MAVKMRILFVDDEPNILQGLQRMLRGMRQEWDMAFASGGEEALDVMSKSGFDVVVTDMRMPGMNGGNFCGK